MMKREKIKERFMLLCPCPEDPTECELEDCDDCPSKLDIINDMLSFLDSQGMKIGGSLTGKLSPRDTSY